MRLLVIAVGGAAGALCRYLLAGWVQSLAASLFPFGTLAVNVLGCFLFGILATMLTGAALVPEPVRLLLLVGFLGAFTTFSTFGWETVAMLDDGETGLAIANVLASNLLGFAGVWVGLRLVGA